MFIYASEVVGQQLSLGNVSCLVSQDAPWLPSSLRVVADRKLVDRSANSVVDGRFLLVNGRQRPEGYSGDASDWYGLSHLRRHCVGRLRNGVRVRTCENVAIIFYFLATEGLNVDRSLACVGNSKQISLQLLIGQPIIPKISWISRSNRRVPICLFKCQSSSIPRLRVIFRGSMRHGNSVLVFAGAYVRVDQYLMITMGFLIIAASHNNLFISTKSSCPQPQPQPKTSMQKPSTPLVFGLRALCQSGRAEVGAAVWLIKVCSVIEIVFHESDVVRQCHQQLVQYYNRRE